MDEVVNGSRGSSYAALKKLDPMSSDKNSNFTLPAHDEEDLSPADSAERLAEYFSAVS